MWYPCYTWNTSKFCSFCRVCLHQAKGCKARGCCHCSYQCRTWTKSSSCCTSSNATTTDLPCSIPCASAEDVCTSTNAWQISIPSCDELPCLPIWPTTWATLSFVVIIAWYCPTDSHSLADFCTHYDISKSDEDKLGLLKYKPGNNALLTLTPNNCKEVKFTVLG